MSVFLDMELPATIDKVLPETVHPLACLADAILDNKLFTVEDFVLAYLGTKFKFSVTDISSIFFFYLKKNFSIS